MSRAISHPNNLDSCAATLQDMTVVVESIALEGLRFFCSHR